MRAGTEVLLLLACLPGPLAAQGVLDEFSYDGLYFAGLGVDVGAIFSDRLDRAVSAAVRIDAGFFAPHVRPLLSLGFYRSDYAADEIARLEQQLRNIVTDPTNDFTIDAGDVTLSALTVDLELQYLPLTRGPVRPYVGVGAGAHLRFAEGQAIKGTFVEGALETVAAALNGSAGFEVVLSRQLRVTVEGRGILASGLKAATLRGGLMLRFPHGAN